MVRRTFRKEARAPFKDCSSARSPCLSQPKPTSRVSLSIRQNFHSGDTSALTPLQRSTKIGPVAEIQTPNDKLPPRSQSELSHESYLMKRKLGDDHLSASGEQKRQHYIPPNKALVGLQSSQVLKPQSMRSGPVAGGVMQVLAVDFSVLRFFLGDKAGVQGDIQI